MFYNKENEELPKSLLAKGFICYLNAVGTNLGLNRQRFIFLYIM